LEKLSDGVLKSYLETLLPKVVSFFWCVILALLVYYIGVRILSLFRKGVQRGLKRHTVETGVCQFLDQLIKIIGYIVIIILILGLFGVSTSSVAAAVASAGLTAGLALQGSLSNFAGGVLILVLKPFTVGDYIIEDTNKNEGTVTEISIFYTKLRTIDNKIIVVPNGTLANSSLTNATKSDRRLIDLTFSIGYDDDIDLAKSVILNVVNQEDKRLSEETVNVFVSALSASSVDLGLRFWVPTDAYWEIRWRTLEKVKKSFDERGITIPYQQIDVNMKENV